MEQMSKFTAFRLYPSPLFLSFDCSFLEMPRSYVMVLVAVCHILVCIMIIISSVVVVDCLTGNSINCR